jgi:Xaa-Pro aminopeptidase
LAALLIYGDTERSAALRHEVPLGIGDPFLYAEVDGRKVILTNVLERARIAAVLPGAELLSDDDLGKDELIAEGLGADAIELELAVRAVRRIGVGEAVVPPEFPIGLADRLRDEAVFLEVDAAPFVARRRTKTAAELAGIRRAQAAAEAAMGAAAAVLRAAEPVDGVLHRGGSPLRAEDVRGVLRDTCAAHGALLGPDAMVTSAWSGGGHEPGSGPLPANLPIEIDLWPRDEESACFADMTRTFVVGEITGEVAALRDIVRDALEQVRAATRPGVTGRALYEIAAGVVEAAGHPTQRTSPGGNTGFYFGLGHGVGLEVHEPPALGRSGREPLVAGDVVAVEPGIEGTAVGGVRYEDLLLVTDDGCDTLTRFPYDLTP